MSGRGQPPVATTRTPARESARTAARESARTPSLRSTLFEAACDVAMEAEIEAMIDAALAPYDNDPEPPMVGFRDSMDDLPEDDDCPICRDLNEQYGVPILTQLPDGSVLEIRRAKSAEAMPAS